MTILNELKQSLQSLVTNLYWGEVPSTATYPYVVGTFASSIDDENGTVTTMHLDYWARTKAESTVLETLLTDAGNGRIENPSGLNHRHIYCTDGSVYLALDSCEPITDPDKSLRRYRADYTVRTYQK